MKIDRKYKELAREFCDAVKRLADRPAALDNLESYLSIHFSEWMEKWASTPEGITGELRCFSVWG